MLNNIMTVKARPLGWLAITATGMLLVFGCQKGSDSADTSEGAGGAASADGGGAMAAAGELVPLDLVLPEAMFLGTPQSLQGVENLAKPLGHPRPAFLVPAGTQNIASGKSVTSSDMMPIIGELELVTDGDKRALDGSYVELGPFLQHVTVDLGAVNQLFAVVFWHYHRQARVYFDVVVQVADDPDFTTNVTTIYNNDHDNSSGMGVGTDMNYIETSEGNLVDARGVHGRYIRLYSNGNNGNELNHYIEVEVHGKPVEMM